MKECHICKLVLPLSSFNKNKAKRDGHQDGCRDCGKSRFRKYYQENKTNIIENVTRNKKKRYKLVYDLISGYKTQCLVCKEDNILCLDLHHNKGVKLFNLGECAYLNVTLAQITEEISKCVCLCSNCHRKLHGNSFCLL